MQIKGIEISIKQIICLSIYYAFAQFIPSPLGGRWLRGLLARGIFAYCGKNVNIEFRANFGSGRDIHLGDNSGLGIRCRIPSNTHIGSNVMMGPNCVILPYNHRFDRKDIPMIEQGFSPALSTVIEDDVWIGRDVIMTPGRHIAEGSIVAAGCVLCKDFPAYSIIGGNPSKLIRTR